MTTTMTQDQVAEALKGCRAVQAINPWGDRLYVNLWDQNRTFRGDQSTKFFVDARGVVNYERGKGTWSPGFADSVEIVLAFLAEKDLPMVKR